MFCQDSIITKFSPNFSERLIFITSIMDFHYIDEFLTLCLVFVQLMNFHHSYKFSSHWCNFTSNDFFQSGIFFHKNSLKWKFFIFMIYFPYISWILFMLMNFYTLNKFSSESYIFITIMTFLIHWWILIKSISSQQIDQFSLYWKIMLIKCFFIKIKGFHWDTLWKYDWLKLLF